MEDIKDKIKNAIKNIRGVLKRHVDSLIEEELAFDIIKDGTVNGGYLKFNNAIPGEFREKKKECYKKCTDLLEELHKDAHNQCCVCDDNCIARITKYIRGHNKNNDGDNDNELEKIKKYIHGHNGNNVRQGNIKCENGVIEISNLIFEGKVNLDYGNFTHALKLSDCVFENGLSLHHTKLPALELTNAIIKIKNEDIKTEDKNSDLYAINLMGTECGHIKIEDSYIDGGVTAINADIKGKFRVVNNIITACNETKDAIHANDIKVSGSFLLEDSLMLGSTSMRRAKIKSRLSVLGSVFFESIYKGGQSGHSVDLRDSVVEGDVLIGIDNLRDGVLGGGVLIGIDDSHKEEKESPCFIGRLIMKDIVIRGSLICSKGIFIGLDKTKVSIDVSGSEINSSFHIRNHAKVKGELNIERADIGGNWSCKNSKFIGYPQENKQWAMEARNATIKGSVYFNCSKKDKKDTDGFYAIGCIGMSGIHIEGKWDCEGANINPGCHKDRSGTPLSIWAENISVGVRVSFSQGFNSNDGRVNIINININGNFNCDNCRIGSLLMQGSKIGGEFNLNDYYSYSIVANGATVGGSVHIENMRIYDIEMNGILVNGNMLIKGGNFIVFYARGAKILGHFNWNNEKYPPIEIEENRKKLKNKLEKQNVKLDALALHLQLHIREQRLSIINSIEPYLSKPESKIKGSDKVITAIIHFHSLQAGRITIKNINIDARSIKKNKKLQLNMTNVKTQYLVLDNIKLKYLDLFARGVQSPVISIEGGVFREIDLCESNAKRINFRKNRTGEAKQPPVISKKTLLNNIDVSDGVCLNIKSENKEDGEDDNIKSKSIWERIKYIYSKEFWRAAPVKKKKTANIELEDAKTGDHLVTNQNTLEDATINLKGCDYATYKILEEGSDDRLAAESKNTLPPKKAGECLIKAIDNYCVKGSETGEQKEYWWKNPWNWWKNKNLRELRQKNIFEELSGARNQVVQATRRMGHEEAARNLLYRIFEYKEIKNIKGGKIFIWFFTLFCLIVSSLHQEWQSGLSLFGVFLIIPPAVIVLTLLYIFLPVGKKPTIRTERRLWRLLWRWGLPISRFLLFLSIPLSFILWIPEPENLFSFILYILYVGSSLWLFGKWISVFYYIKFNYALFALFIIIISSAAIFDHAGREGRMVPSAIIQASPKYTNQNSNNIDKLLPEDTGKPFINYQTFNPLIYSLDVFIPFFSLQQENSWQPNVCAPEQEQQPPDESTWLNILPSNCEIDIWGWRYWATYIMEVIFGWLLTGAMILHMTNLRRIVKGGNSS